MIERLRAALMDSIADVRAKKPGAIESAKAVSQVATVLINSAKVEVDYLRVTGQKNSAIFRQQEPRMLEGSPK